MVRHEDETLGNALKTERKNERLVGISFTFVFQGFRYDRGSTKRLMFAFDEISFFCSADEDKRVSLHVFLVPLLMFQTARNKGHIAARNSEWEVVSKNPFSASWFRSS